MKFGIVLPNYGLTTDYASIRRAATAAGSLGYTSAWTTDHLLVPRPFMDPYGTMFDALVTLALVAALTPHLTLGTSVLVLPMRNPVLTAKQIVTIDAATQGRMIVGVGVGWSEDEYTSLGSNFHNRGRRLDEDIVVLRTLWSQHEVAFHGKYTQIDDGYSAPLAARPQGIPIWIGGNGEPSWRRVARLGDGWHATGPSPEEMRVGMQRISELKPERRIALSARLSIDFDPNVSPTFQYRGNTRYRIAGTPEVMRARLQQYAEAGVEHMVLVFPWEKGTDAALAQMERFARDLMPELG